MGKLLTVRQAAKVLSVSVWHVYRLVQKRKVPFVRVGTRAIRFRSTDLEAWLRSHTEEADALAKGAKPDGKDKSHLARPGTRGR